MIKSLADEIRTSRPRLAFSHIWQAYAELDKVKDKPEQELPALVSLLRRVAGIDDKITPFEKTVRKNFQEWTFAHNARAKTPFTDEQMHWLDLIKTHIIQSFSINADDFELTPFNQYGGLGVAYDVLCENGDDFDALLDEINRLWVA